MNIFMVEVLRSATDDSRPTGLKAAGQAVLCWIDIPADDLTLYLVAAADAAHAESLIRGQGLQAIRVTAVDVRRARLSVDGCQGIP